MAEVRPKPASPWTAESRYFVIRTVWPAVSPQIFDNMEGQYSAYLDFVYSEINTYRNYSTTPEELSVTDVIKLISELKEARTLMRDDAANVASHHITADNKEPVSTLYETNWTLVELLLRIWLTLDIRLLKTMAHGPYAATALTQDTFIPWTETTPLGSLIASHFKAQKAPAPRLWITKIDPTLTIERLVNNYGFTVHWTSNLADHLRVTNDPDSREITVYEHKICLDHHLESQSFVIPKVVLEEALDTLNLLFPFEDRSTKSFLQKHRKPFYGLGRCNRERVLDLDKYVYWRASIEDLLDVLKEPPRGFQQLRLDRDRQNLMQILTFWIAAVVALLTIISFVFGLISTIYAKKQYDIAVLQYQLSLAQACSVQGA